MAFKPSFIGLAAVLGTILSLSNADAGAFEVTFTLTGTVDQVTGDALDGSIVAGTAFTATYVFESTALDIASAPEVGNYLFTVPPNSFSLTIGNYFLRAVSGGSLAAIVTNADQDVFTFSATGDESNLPGITNGFNLTLTDTTGLALTSDALPLAPVLSAFDEPRFVLSGVLPGGSAYSAIGTITSLASTAVPEPATGSGIGLLALMFLRRKGIRP